MSGFSRKFSAAAIFASYRFHIDVLKTEILQKFEILTQEIRRTYDPKNLATIQPLPPLPHTHATHWMWIRKAKFFVKIFLAFCFNKFRFQNFYNFSLPLLVVKKIFTQIPGSILFHQSVIGEGDEVMAVADTDKSSKPTANVDFRVRVIVNFLSFNLASRNRLPSSA